MTPKPRDISVLIATPHLMVRELLMGALKRQRQFNVVGCATTGREVLEAVHSNVIDVALMTATLADGPLSGLGAMRQIRERFPELKSVILLNAPERNLVVDVFRAGARGVFQLSASSFRSLCRCVEQVHAGQIWASSGELSEVMGAFSQLAPMQVVNADGMRLLTKREEDVVRLLVEGMQNRDIARELNLSIHTVKNYLFHIFDKLGVSSRVELVMYAVTSTNRIHAADVHGNTRESELIVSPRIAPTFFVDEDQDSGAQSPEAPGGIPAGQAWPQKPARSLDWTGTEPGLSSRSA